MSKKVLAYALYVLEREIEKGVNVDRFEEAEFKTENEVDRFLFDEDDEFISHNRDMDDIISVGNDSLISLPKKSEPERVEWLTLVNKFETFKAWKMIDGKSLQKFLTLGQHVDNNDAEEAEKVFKSIWKLSQHEMCPCSVLIKGKGDIRKMYWQPVLKWRKELLQNIRDQKVESMMEKMENDIRKLYWSIVQRIRKSRKKPSSIDTVDRIRLKYMCLYSGISDAKTQVDLEPPTFD
jgi:predicted RND superfamily exporter protein